MKDIDQDSVPSTVKAAVDILVARMDDDDKKHIRTLKDKGASVHHTIGRFVRNSWSLWEPDSPLKRDAVNTYWIAHADDISGLIMAWVWAEVRNEEFDPHKECERFHKHWNGYGTDSLSAGGWPPKEKKSG